MEEDNMKEIENVANIVIKAKNNGKFDVEVLEIVDNFFHKWHSFEDINQVMSNKLAVEKVLANSSIIQLFTASSLTGCKLEAKDNVKTLTCYQKSKPEKT